MAKSCSKFISNLIVWVASFFIYLYINLVWYTSRIVIKGAIDELTKYLETKDSKGLVFFIWHNKILLSPIIASKIFKEIDKFVLISGKNEGRIAKKISKKFGINSVKTFNVKYKNSASFDDIDKRRAEFHQKYGKNLSSLKRTVKILEKNNIFLFAADAIKGHAFEFSSSMLPLIKKTNSAISYCAISYRNYKQFNTWDKFQLPFPFNSICIELGNIHRGQDFIENMELVLTKELNNSLKNNSF